MELILCKQKNLKASNYRSISFKFVFNNDITFTLRIQTSISKHSLDRGFTEFNLIIILIRNKKQQHLLLHITRSSEASK